jgi:DNA-binding transcriptional ArsR family regulator
MLALLFRTSPLAVVDIAAACGLTPPRASVHLRALQARGLIEGMPQGRNVLYRPHADPRVSRSEPLLALLRRSLQRPDDDRAWMSALTAITHTRRLRILHALSHSPAEVDELVHHCHISRPALYRHLHKLKRRGVIEHQDDFRYALVPLPPGLLQDLLHLALMP